MDMITSQLQQWGDNFYRNLTGMWDDMTGVRYIRMIVVVGAYFLIRPYLQKLGDYIQAKQLAKEIDPAELAPPVPKGKITPNQLRGGSGPAVAVPESDDEEDEEGGEGAGETTGANWGKQARKRQRQMVKKVLEDEARRRKDEEDEEEIKDIREYLVDYVEGEDGW